MTQQYPQLLPSEVIRDWYSRLPMDARIISPKVMTQTFPEDIDLILASSPVLSKHLPMTHKNQGPHIPFIAHRISMFIWCLAESQPAEGVGCVWDSTRIYSPTAHTLSLLGQGMLIDAPICDSWAYRNNRVWKNLVPRSVLEAEHARLLKPTRPIETSLEASRLSTWSTHPRPPTGRDLSLNVDLPPREPLPHLCTHPNTSPFRVHNGISENGVLYATNLPSTPSPELREALVGFRVGETDVPSLSTA